MRPLVTLKQFLLAAVAGAAFTGTLWAVEPRVETRVEPRSTAATKTTPTKVDPNFQKSQMPVQWQLDQLRALAHNLAQRVAALEAQQSPNDTSTSDLAARLSQLETALQVSSSGVTLQSSSTISISAATVNLNAALTQASGTVKADTVITEAVVSKSYTPGAGNIW